MAGSGEIVRVDVVHLSDIQVGARCRFAVESAAADLRQALVDDIRRLEAEGYLDPETPRIIAVTGDIADAAEPKEYGQAQELLSGLATDLGVPAGRIVVVPGNHDVSWLDCEYHFKRCRRDGIKPEPPFYPKLGCWEEFFNDLYQDVDETARPAFNVHQPWTIYTFSDLGLQVLGLNSCWEERHGKVSKYHYGLVDPGCLHTMLDTARVQPQTITIALAHHNPLPDLVKPTASLRDGRQVLECLDEHGVRLLLCGHGHMADGLHQSNPYGGGQGVTVLAAGSVSVVAGERPEDVRNQYQVVQLGPEPRVLRLAYNPHLAGFCFDADPVRNKWIWDLSPWVSGTAKAPPPTVEALIDTYRRHCRGAYQDLVGSLYRRQDQVTHPLISQVYVPLKLQPPEPERPDDGDEQEALRQHEAPITIEDYLERTGNQPQLLAGAAGSGKTTFLRYRLGCWAEAEPSGDLLLYVPLGRLADHLEESAKGVKRLWEALGRFLVEEGVPFSAKQLAELAEEGRLGLLLDGLDELRSSLRPVLAEALQAALGRSKGLRVILSSRPHALADAQALPGFTVRTIHNLDDEQRRLFLQRYHERLFEPIPARAEQECERLISAMAAHRDLYKLGSTPLMLLGLAVVHYRYKRLPHGRDEVFRALTEAVLELRLRSDEERRRHTRRLQQLALAMHERGEREVSLPVLEALITTVLADESGRKPCQADLQECLDQLLGVCGLVEGDEHRARFLHLGFQEYLAATALAFRLQGEFTSERIEDRYLDDAWWREAMAMLVSLLSRGDTGYEGIRLWRHMFERRRKGQTPVARLAQLAESLQELEPQCRPDLAAEEAQLKQEIVALIEDMSQPGSLDDRIAAAEALGRLGDPRCSDLPPKMVRISDDLEISAYPITVAQYRHFVDAGGYRPEVFGEQRFNDWQEGIEQILADEEYEFLWERLRSGRDRTQPDWWPAQLWTPNRPVVGISWFEACAFCDWLARTGEDGKYRLPYEQEWERVAGGKGRNEPYPWGDHGPGDGAGARANYDGLGMKEPAPTPVGLFPSGAADWGKAGKLSDISGNVWAWCNDTLSQRGQLEDGGLFRPLRGGGYWHDAEYLEVSYRDWNLAALWDGRVGLRVVRSRRRPPALGS